MFEGCGWEGTGAAGGGASFGSTRPGVGANRPEVCAGDSRQKTRTAGEQTTEERRWVRSTLKRKMSLVACMQRFGDGGLVRQGGAKQLTTRVSPKRALRPAHLDGPVARRAGTATTVGGSAGTVVIISADGGIDRALSLRSLLGWHGLLVHAHCGGVGSFHRSPQRSFTL